MRSQRLSRGQSQSLYAMQASLCVNNHLRNLRRHGANRTPSATRTASVCPRRASVSSVYVPRVRATRAVVARISACAIAALARPFVGGTAPVQTLVHRAFSATRSRQATARPRNVPLRGALARASQGSASLAKPMGPCLASFIIPSVRTMARDRRSVRGPAKVPRIVPPASSVARIQAAARRSVWRAVTPTRIVRRKSLSVCRPRTAASPVRKPRIPGLKHVAATPPTAKASARPAPTGPRIVTAATPCALASRRLPWHLFARALAPAMRIVGMGRIVAM